MKLFQCADHLYPGSIRFVGFATQDEFHPVWQWLNDVMPGGFTIVEVPDEMPAMGRHIYWEEVYIKEKSDAALFKLTWCGNNE